MRNGFVSSENYFLSHILRQIGPARVSLCCRALFVHAPTHTRARTHARLITHARVRPERE